MENYYKDNQSLKFHLQHPLMQRIVTLRENNFRDFGTFDDAPSDATDALDNYDKVLEIVGEIAGEIMAVYAEAVDQSGPKIENNEIIYAEGTQKSHEACRNAGLYGMSLPRKYGGLNFSYVPYVMAAEIVSRADTAFGNIWGLQDCAETLVEFASEEIKNEYIPRVCQGETCSMDLTEPDAGSDLQSVRLKATFDEKAQCWRLNGVKRFITNGDADIKLVLARSEEGTADARGLSYFVYDRNSKAVTIRRIENKMGIKGSPTAELVFNNAPAQLVGDRKMGLIKYVMSLMNGARLGVAAQSIGLAEAACREAVKYAAEREQFGKPINQFVQVREMLQNMRAKTDASRALLYETCRFVDIYKALSLISQERPLSSEEKIEMKLYQKLADLYTPLVKLFASEFCNQIAYDAVQIHGGSGYMKDYPVERLYRDARITNIYEGTSQLQVVAAIRGIGNGLYISKIKEYGNIEVKSEWQDLKIRIQAMIVQLEDVLKLANDWGTTSEQYDYHARRMVEMAGYVIMSELILLDATKDEMFAQSARDFIVLAEGEIAKAAKICKG